MLLEGNLEPLVVLSDMNQPDGNALDLLEKVRGRGIAGEWIFLTAYGGIPERWLHLGASATAPTTDQQQAKRFHPWLYWTTIMFSQTLGTALGDWTADTAGLGYEGGALIFGAMLAFLALAYYKTKISRTLLFWLAFILTRPLGAVLGDLLDKPVAAGGLDLSRYSASLALVVFIVACLLLFKHRAATKAH